MVANKWALPNDGTPGEVTAAMEALSRELETGTQEMKAFNQQWRRELDERPARHRSNGQRPVSKRTTSTQGEGGQLSEDLEADGGVGRRVEGDDHDSQGVGEEDREENRRLRGVHQGPGGSDRRVSTEEGRDKGSVASSGWPTNDSSPDDRTEGSGTPDTYCARTSTSRRRPHPARSPWSELGGYPQLLAITMIIMAMFGLCVLLGFTGVV